MTEDEGGAHVLGAADNVEEALDVVAQRSRYTPTESPQDKPMLVDHVSSMLANLTPAEQAAAETHGFASMPIRQAAELLGKRPFAVQTAWSQVVEKFTGETPEGLERERQRQREKQRRKRARWYAEERRTGVAPPALQRERERERNRHRDRKKSS